MDKVILATRRPFGGSRISGGTVAVDLWSDGAVLGTAWTFDQPEIAGELFTFRGTLRRASSCMPRRYTWRLGDQNGALVDYFPTRQAALDAVDAKITLDAFRALNRLDS